MLSRFLHVCQLSFKRGRPPALFIDLDGVCLHSARDSCVGEAEPVQQLQVRTCTSAARDCFTGPDLLSRIWKSTPCSASNAASINPAGPAPMIRTSVRTPLRSLRAADRVSTIGVPPCWQCRSRHRLYPRERSVSC